MYTIKGVWQDKDLNVAQKIFATVGKYPLVITVAAVKFFETIASEAGNDVYQFTKKNDTKNEDD